jgi:glyoxylase-like metal-dependent hydrolase (beta-lactamase superfamily II)
MTLETTPSVSTSPKPPRQVLEAVYAFPPNRETLGGTAYLIVSKDLTGAPANLMVDCPALDYQSFIEAQGGIRGLMLTHRNGHSRVQTWQTQFHCQVVVQEQEAYLLPAVAVTPFHQTFTFDTGHRAIWTPGYSPGSACLYGPDQGGMLFTGRHLLPNQAGMPQPLRFAKTFHWPRQLRSVQQLQSAFTAETLAYLCPGANTGFLRGRRVIERAYEQLQAIDLEACRQMPVGL